MKIDPYRPLSGHTIAELDERLLHITVNYAGRPQSVPGYMQPVVAAIRAELDSRRATRFKAMAAYVESHTPASPAREES